MLSCENFFSYQCLFPGRFIFALESFTSFMNSYILRMLFLPLFRYNQRTFNSFMPSTFSIVFLFCCFQPLTLTQMFSRFVHVTKAFYHFLFPMFSFILVLLDSMLYLLLIFSNEISYITHLYKEISQWKLLQKRLF